MRVGEGVCANHAYLRDWGKCDCYGWLSPVGEKASILCTTGIDFVSSCAGYCRIFFQSLSRDFMQLQINDGNKVTLQAPTSNSF